MVLIKPEHQVRHQEVADLIAAVVEDQRAPFLVLTDARIGVLVEVGSIEEGKPVGILREVARHPIEDHTDALGMAAVHEGAELIRATEAAGGRVPAGHLITPGAIKGMLGDRHQFDVGETPRLHVGDHLVGQFGIGEQAGAGFQVRRRHWRAGCAVGFDVGLVGGGVDPAAEMHLVHRDRAVEGIASFALLNPGVVPPVVAAELGHHRGVIGAHLVAETVGVGLLVAVTILGPHFVFVDGALTQPRDEQLPAAAQSLLHRMVAAIPAVEITEHRHTAGVGSPEAELHPGHPVVAHGVGAHPLPDVVVVAFGE